MKIVIGDECCSYGNRLVIIIPGVYVKVSMDQCSDQ